jgi:hypothetical protein
LYPKKKKKVINHNNIINFKKITLTVLHKNTTSSTRKSTLAMSSLTVLHKTTISTHKPTVAMSTTSSHKDTPPMSPLASICTCSFLIVFFIGVGLLITHMFRSADVGTTGLLDRPLLAVDSVGSLNSLKVNVPKFTTEFNISISVYNPTSYSRVYYDAVSAEVFYRGESLVLSKISLPSFTTHSHNTSTVKMTLLVNISDDFGGVATGIALSRKNGMVEFGLIVSALFKYKNRWAQSDWTSLKVVCNPLKFAVSPNDYNTTTPGILLKGLMCWNFL